MWLSHLEDVRPAVEGKFGVEHGALDSKALEEEAQLVPLKMEFTQTKTGTQLSWI